MKNSVVKKLKAADLSTVAHPIWKFLIGTFAGISAITFPRLGAMLSIADTSGEVSYQFFPAGYLIVSVAAAAIIGVIVAILEFRVPKRPRETFMAALAVPALLAGVFNASSGISVLKETKAESARIVESVQRQSGIPKLDAPTEIFSIEEDPKPSPSSGFLLEKLLGISVAVAADNLVVSASKASVGFAVTAEEPRYVVVLEKASSKEDAIARAKRLEKLVPNARAIRTETGFYVIQPGAKTESEATLDALKLKKQQLNPSLLRVPATAD